MPIPLAVPLAISGISALGGLFANRAQKQQQESTERTVADINELSAPEYDANTLAMRNLLMNQYLSRALDTQDIYGGYRTSGLANINTGADVTGRAIENVLSSRGLGGTTAGATSAVMNQINRLNQQNQFLNQIPLLADERAAKNLQAAGQFWSQIPIGTRKTGQNVQTTTKKGTVTSPGNMLGGSLASLGTSLAGLYGAGAFGGRGTGGIAV